MCLWTCVIRSIVVVHLVIGSVLRNGTSANLSAAFMQTLGASMSDHAEELDRILRHRHSCSHTRLVHQVAKCIGQHPNMTTITIIFIRIIAIIVMIILSIAITTMLTIDLTTITTNILPFPRLRRSLSSLMACQPWPEHHGARTRRWLRSALKTTSPWPARKARTRRS